MMHAGRELGRIQQHVRRRNREAGEFLYWYQYQPVPISTFDDVYDEGPVGSALGRRFSDPVKVPTIYASEVEDAMVLREDARKPTQNSEFVILLKDARDAGVVDPGEYNAHLNDLLSYDRRFYKVSRYKATGRLDGEVLLTITCYEVFLDEEFVLDPDINDAGTDLWPSTFPSV